MNREPEKNQKTKRLNGTIWSIIVLALMVVALVIFVMTSDRSKSVTSIALNQTVTALQALPTGTTTLINGAYPISPPLEVNINGILVMGGLLVLVVFFTVIREAILHKRTQ
ncbi:MAG TPA: hypothetical protein DD636_04015 [Anaerolineaceae bacterium]|jgi:hypothetical protein|nr:hypothetical protein [Anaerolineaceae bacterium]